MIDILWKSSVSYLKLLDNWILVLILAHSLTDGGGLLHVAGAAVRHGPHRHPEPDQSPEHRLHPVPAAEASRRHRQCAGARHPAGTVSQAPSGILLQRLTFSG